MRVLVTGREGQLVQSLLERATAHPALHLFNLGRPILDLERLDTIAPAVAALAPDLVINAAAYTAVDQAQNEPERALLINGVAAGELAAASKAAGAPMIQISTDYVFDGRACKPYTENALTGPINVYGRSKLDGEIRVRAVLADHMIVRLAWVYSPFGRNFVKTMMNAARTRSHLSVVADQHGSPTSALDIADALLLAADAIRTGRVTSLGHTYHLAASGVTSWHGLATLIFEQCARLGLPTAEVAAIASSQYPTPAARPVYSVLSSETFAETFGHRIPNWRASVEREVCRIGAHP